MVRRCFYSIGTENLGQQEEMNANDERLGRILRDLLGRVGERVYLCHSELAVNGQEQNGPLLPLVNAAVPIASESVLV